MSDVLPLTSRIEEVAFAELDTVVTQDVVRRRDVKEHVGNRPPLQKLQSLELERPLTRGHLDVARLRAFERALRYTLQIIDRARKPGSQLLDGGLVVVEARGLLSGESRHGVLGDVAGDLHLTRERQHVGPRGARRAKR